MGWLFENYCKDYKIVKLEKETEKLKQKLKN